MITDRELLEHYMALVARIEGITFLQYEHLTRDVTPVMLEELRKIEAGPMVQCALQHCY